MKLSTALVSNFCWACFGLHTHCLQEFSRTYKKPKQKIYTNFHTKCIR